MRKRNCPLAPVLGGEGWGEGLFSRAAQLEALRSSPLTPTLSPEYEGEGAGPAPPLSFTPYPLSFLPCQTSSHKSTRLFPSPRQTFSRSPMLTNSSSFASSGLGPMV